MRGRADSVSRRVNAERIVLLGWSRAILLQLAHPLVAAGVAEHSSFRGGPFAAAARLHHTIRSMLALTFGDNTQREAALETIRAIHRRVNGHLPTAVGRFSSGTPYSAEDPDLVLWVHATLLDSLPLVYEHLVAPLDADGRDAYCNEAADVAIALGAREVDVPRTWGALGHYMDVMYLLRQHCRGPASAGAGVGSARAAALLLHRTSHLGQPHRIGGATT